MDKAEIIELLRDYHDEIIDIMATSGTPYEDNLKMTIQKYADKLQQQEVSECEHKNPKWEYVSFCHDCNRAIKILAETSNKKLKGGNK